MDKEEFQAWKDSRATQWVLKRLLARAGSIKEQASDLLYQSTGASPEEWASLQARVAYDRGVATALTFVADLEHHEVDDSDESERD